MATDMTPADRLRAALTRKGMSDRQFAKELGVEPGTVSKWLSGEREPRGWGRVSAMAKILDVFPHWLAEGGEFIADGERAPVDDAALDVVSVVAGYPRRWAPIDVAEGIVAWQGKGVPKGGWKAWLDRIKRERSASKKAVAPRTSRRVSQHRPAA